MADATKLIDKKIAGLTDWRGNMMARLRTIILSVNSEISEEFKWNTPVFTYNGNVCALGVFKDHVKINFFKGAQLTDPKKLLNSGLEAKLSRSINFNEGDTVNEKALKKLVREAASLNE